MSDTKSKTTACDDLSLIREGRDYALRQAALFRSQGDDLYAEYWDRDAAARQAWIDGAQNV